MASLTNLSTPVRISNQRYGLIWKQRLNLNLSTVSSVVIANFYVRDSAKSYIALDPPFHTSSFLISRQRIFYQTRSIPVILYDTLPAEFIEKAICMKTKDQLYQRECVVLRPRDVLRANSQSGPQDLLVQEARSQQDAESYGETRSNTADYRIPGISISTVKLQDARRQNNVTKLIEMFEKHLQKEKFF